MAQWLKGEKEQSSDTLETITSMLYRKKIITKQPVISIKQDELKVLHNYVKLSELLKKLQLRWLFPFNSVLENYIQELL